MLRVTFNYQNEQPIFETLLGLSFKYDNSTYILKELGYTATAIHDAASKKLILTFSKELSFDQYKQLNKVIKTIADKIQAFVDDHEALMGYLEDGKEAYIFHGWSKWVLFLEGAKHVSMEGQKVQVFNENELLSDGILIDVRKDETEKEDFRITQCTIITKTGEKVLSGTNLKIVATGEF
jgi:hypothetical protein